jgi:hypothetical protein
MLVCRKGGRREGEGEGRERNEGGKEEGDVGRSLSLSPPLSRLS